MPWSNAHWRRALRLLLPGLVLGCTPSARVARCAALPRGAIPVRPGRPLRGIGDAQALEAEADDFVIYRNEWQQDSAVPGPFGHYHLGLMARRLPGVPFPVIIQPDPHAGGLNEGRRQAVVGYLLTHGIADAEARVRV